MTRETCPEDKANPISRLFYCWITRLIIQGYRRPLEFEDLWAVRSTDTSHNVVTCLEKHWKKQLCRTGWALIPDGNVHNDGNVELQELKAIGDNQAASKKSYRPDSISSADTIEANVPDVIVEHGEKKGPSLWRAVFGGFGAYYLGAGLLKLVGDLIPFINSQVLGLLLTYLADPDAPLWKGYVYAIIPFIVSAVRTLLNQTQWHMCYRTGMRVRSALVGIIYRKSLRLSSGSRRDYSSGEILNLMAVDAQRLQDAPAYLHNLWTAPIIVAVALYFLWQELGPSALAGLGAMLVVMPINACVAQRVRLLQIKQLKRKDERIKMTNEVLNGIKVLKLYAWEESFKDQLSAIRDSELVHLRGIALLGAGTAISLTLLPFLVALASFSCFVLISEDNVLDAKKTFVSLALFNLLNFPLSVLPNTISIFIQTTISMQRICSFLKTEELDPENTTAWKEEDSAVRIRKGAFSWGKDSPAVLRNIFLKVPAGKLVAIVGQVGTGKSSLLSAMLGEMQLQQGKVHLRGNVAFVPQQAWIQNATVRANILFGREYHKAVYDTVLDACALEPDMKILTAGDQTEIGEKGINLSGGQRQRISLGRAVYQNSDVYLLDDPLSAVDSHVGKHIFEKVIGPEGVLSGKTRVMVTNSLWVLPHVDEVFVLSDGRISERGTYKDLIQFGGRFAEFVAMYLSEQKEEEDEDEEVKDMRRMLGRHISSISENRSIVLQEEEDEEDEEVPGGLSGKEDFCLLEDKDKYLAADRIEQAKGLIEKEKEETGSVSVAVIMTYFRACGFCSVTWGFISTILYIVTRVGTSIWLGQWSDDSYLNSTGTSQQELNDIRNLRLGVYGALGAAQGLFAFMLTVAVAIACYNSSRILHAKLLYAILRAPMSFFDTTPLGRILNRFTKDMDVLDLIMPNCIRFFLITIASVLTKLILISYSTPIFLVAVIPIVIVYCVVQRVYIVTSRQLKRIDSTQRSPIFTNFGESLAGADSIRAYAKEEQFTDLSDELVDNNNMAYYPSIVSNRWLGIYMELLGSVIVLLAAMAVVFQKSSISPGDAGLSVAFALQVTTVLNYSVRAMCDLENNVVSAERVKEYANAPQEAPVVNPDYPAPDGWPSQGKVEVHNYALRYRPGLDLVLKGVNAMIQPREKVGIVGRTGAGKSSLTLALFRIVEAADGMILIDGQDIANLGLHDLRSRLTIIPQDPVVFSGTLRMNLDPFETLTDENIWNVLEESNLKTFVRSLSGNLDFVCAEGGDNVSVGQRQLICLARALLRKTRILVLDEATAAMDVATDDLIQNTIRTQFRDCTVLTIAHRLNTILDYDRIMVLDQGVVAEMDKPSRLKKIPDGIFRGMLADAGLLYDAADDAADERE